MSRSRDIAEILGATEAANSDNRSLGAGVGAPGGGLDSAAVTSLISSDYIQTRQIVTSDFDSADAVNLIDSSYVQLREAASGGGLTTGTVTTAGNLHQLDLSSGNVFSLTATGGTNSIQLTNASEPFDIQVKMTGVQAVEGGYEITSDATLPASSSDDEYYYDPSHTGYSPNNGACGGLTFSPDGMKMFIGSYNQNSNNMAQWDLTTAFDPSTVDGTAPDVEYNMYGSSYLKGWGNHYWSSTGKKVKHIIGRSDYQAHYVTNTLPQAYNLDTTLSSDGKANGDFPSLPSGKFIQCMSNYSGGYWFGAAKTGELYRMTSSASTQVASSGYGGLSGVKDMYLNSDGTVLTFCWPGQINSVTMSTPYDYSTASNSGTALTDMSKFNQQHCAGIAFNADGTEAFVMRMNTSNSRKAVFKIEPDSTITAPAAQLHANHSFIGGSSFPEIANGAKKLITLKSNTSDASEVTAINPATTGGAITVWKSAVVTNSTYGVAVTHGQGSKADKVWAELTCTTANQGWRVGDRLTITHWIEEDETDHALSFYSSDTEIGYRQNNISSILYAAYGPNTNSGGAPVMTASSWDIKICGMWFNSAIVQQGT